MFDRKSIIAFMQEQSYKPLTYRELAAAMGVQPEDEAVFSRLMGRLEKKGSIVRTRRDRYGLPEMMNLVKGVIRIDPRGYGILRPDEPEAGEIFIYGRNLNGAMHLDRVLVRINQKGREGQRPEGEVIRAIERANRELIGIYKKTRSLAQVIPDDPRQIYPVYVTVPRRVRVKNGDRVVVEIYSWPDKNKDTEGRVLEVLGAYQDPSSDLALVIRKHGLRSVFDSRVLAEASRCCQPVSDEERSGRVDLSALPIVTIDGEDAKDLDDAVNIARQGSGYRLGVHIADVSHYVREHSRLDREAYSRGTSVYLIDQVLPMLPGELSNRICSLNAGEDRLAMSCVMELDQEGQLLDYQLFKSVIRVKERMTYSVVNRLIEGDDPVLRQRYSQYMDDFQLMWELAQKLNRARMRRGALEFDFPESKVYTDELGEPVDVVVVQRGPGEKLIEEFMIKANETVAAHLHRHRIPQLLRVHEKPDPEALLKLNNILSLHGYKLNEGHLRPLDLQRILQGIKGSPQESTLSLMLLRSMKHARYSPWPLGHFGLASEYYCHFTSPIRRYPDLLVHRALARCLTAQPDLKGSAGPAPATSKPARKNTGLSHEEIMDAMVLTGDHCSLREIKAEEAERELVAVKKTRYIARFIGDEFAGRISSVTSFGFFVELANTIEGLVHISSLNDDYYDFNDRALTLTGRYTGSIFHIGDPVRVQVVRADIAAARVDFELR